MPPSVSNNHLEDLEPKPRLSQKIWNLDDKGPDLTGSSHSIDPAARSALLAIADKFIKFLGVEINVVDITLTGSMANFTHTDFSDIDLHILINFSEIDDDENLVKEFLSAKKSIWNDRHEIFVRGHQVEVYPQDVGETHDSTGVFSLAREEWVRDPSEISQVRDSNLQKVKKKSEDLMSLIDKTLRQKNRTAKLEKLKDKIKTMRQSGLSRSGEFSVENLVFKVLRNYGYIGKLMTAIREDEDKRLSIDQ